MPSDLNREVLATFDALTAARERLSDLSYVAYIAIVVERVLNEAARLEFGEAIRAARRGS